MHTKADRHLRTCRQQHGQRATRECTKGRTRDYIKIPLFTTCGHYRQQKTRGQAGLENFLFCFRDLHAKLQTNSLWKTLLVIREIGLELKVISQVPPEIAFLGGCYAAMQQSRLLRRSIKK
jgi:hypothetical protein